MRNKNKNRVSIALIIVFSVAFLVTSVLFKIYGITGILAQLTWIYYYGYCYFASSGGSNR